MAEEITTIPSNNGDKSGKDPTNGRFLPGNNLGKGRPPGSLSITTKIKQYLTDHPGQFEKIVEDYISNPKHRQLLWQMLEGKPPQAPDLGTDQGLPFMIKIVKDGE